MAEAITVMDIDDDGDNHLLKLNEGKSVAVGVPPDGKATPWVEKYRPQSLADVAAHRDIVDTSNYPNHLLLGFIFILRQCSVWFPRNDRKRKQNL